MANYAIKTDNLVKIYSHKTVVDHVCMHVKEGSIYGFVGENGSGKTTIMRLLMGLASPQSGTYSLFNVDNKDKKIYEQRKHISAIVEAPSLVPSMNAYDNLHFACMYYGVKDLSIINEVLHLVGLENTGKKKVKNFSLGMRQRLGIAVLLLNKPKLMLLDEPMNGLDPAGIAQLRDLIISLNQKGITFLISSHILSELEKVATDYGFISHGRLIKEISAEELQNASISGVELSYDNHQALINALDKLNIVDYTVIKQGMVKVTKYDNLIDLLILLRKEGIEITNVNTRNEKVEDYYLDLIKGGHKNA